MTAHGRPRLFPGYQADLYGGRNPRAMFDRDLVMAAEMALREQSRAVALAEAIYRCRRLFSEIRRAPRGELLAFADGRYRSRQAERRIDALYARVHRLTALSEHGILAL